MNLPVIDPVTDALICVDLQYDFMPGGALPVEEGDRIVAGISEIIPRFNTVVFTQDWHPREHISFASTHQGRKPYDQISLYGHAHTLWPDHCVQGTHGAYLHHLVPTDSATLILRKGANRLVDSYSAFNENYGLDGKRHATGLMGFLFERRVRKVFVCGLARDVCVKDTCIDAAINGALGTSILWDLTKAVYPQDDAKTAEQLRAANVRIL